METHPDKLPVIYIFSDVMNLTDEMIDRAKRSSVSWLSSAFEKRSLKGLKHSLSAALLLLYASQCSFGMPPESIEISRHDHGKPFFSSFSDRHFNLSHSSGTAVCITAAYPVGIDIEFYRQVSSAIARRVCTENEINSILASDDGNWQFLRFWTLKESYLKATGSGMSFPMKNIEFSLPSQQEGSICASMPGRFFQCERSGALISASALISDSDASVFSPELVTVTLDELEPYMNI